MPHYLKVSIIHYILENIDEFQLVNSTKENFREYIFDSEGNYLIGGEDVNQFIRDACNLLSK